MKNLGHRFYKYKNKKRQVIYPLKAVYKYNYQQCTSESSFCIPYSIYTIYKIHQTMQKHAYQYSSQNCKNYCKNYKILNYYIKITKKWIFLQGTKKYIFMYKYPIIHTHNFRVLNTSIDDYYNIIFYRYKIQYKYWQKESQVKIVRFESVSTSPHWTDFQGAVML